MEDIFGPARTSLCHGSRGWGGGGEEGGACVNVVMYRGIWQFCRGGGGGGGDGNVPEGQLLLPVSRFGLAVRR